MKHKQPKKEEPREIINHWNLECTTLEKIDDVNEMIEFLKQELSWMKK